MVTSLRHRNAATKQRLLHRCVSRGCDSQWRNYLRNLGRSGLSGACTICAGWLLGVEPVFRGSEEPTERDDDTNEGTALWGGEESAQQVGHQGRPGHSC